MKRNMNIRLNLILLCGLLLLMVCTAASADETAEVHIPVLARGADCTAELTDIYGTRLQLLELKDGVPAEFVIECTGLLHFTYSVRLTDKDTEKVQYDHTIYSVDIDVFRGSDDRIFYTISVTEAGSQGEDNKESSIRFINKTEESTATPTPTPTPSSETPTPTPPCCCPPFPCPELPETGFPASRPLQPERVDAAVSHRDTGWALQIPGLGLYTDIVTVPLGEKNFDVSQLDSRAGLLDGYALPGTGTTIITGHDHLSRTEAGPFAYLYDMEIGDRIFFLDPENNILIFEVYANEKIASNDVAGLERIAGTWARSATFITCEDERPEGGYANRRIIAAKPVTQMNAD